MMRTRQSEALAAEGSGLWHQDEKESTVATQATWGWDTVLKSKGTLILHFPGLAPRVSCNFIVTNGISVTQGHPATVIPSQVSAGSSTNYYTDTKSVCESFVTWGSKIAHINCINVS